MQEFLQKNKKEILIIIWMILVSSFMGILRPIGATLIILPGFFSVFLSMIIWENFKKSLIVGVITSIGCFIIFAILFILSGGDSLLEFLF